MTRNHLRLSLALIGLVAVLALLFLAYSLAANGQALEAILVGPGGAFGVVRGLFALLERLGA